MTISRNCVWNVSFSMGLLDNKYLLYIREHGTTTLPFLLRPLFLWTPAFHPPRHFVHTSLLPGTHTRWGIFRSKNAPQPLQFKTHDEKKTATQLVTPSPPFPKNMLVLWYLIMILIKKSVQFWLAWDLLIMFYIRLIYTCSIRFLSLANVTKEVEQCMSLCKIHHESNGMRYS